MFRFATSRTSGFRSEIAEKTFRLQLMHSCVGENGESNTRNEQPGNEKTYAVRPSALAALTKPSLSERAMESPTSTAVPILEFALYVQDFAVSTTNSTVVHFC